MTLNLHEHNNLITALQENNIITNNQAKWLDNFIFTIENKVEYNYNQSYEPVRKQEGLIYSKVEKIMTKCTLNYYGLLNKYGTAINILEKFFIACKTTTDALEYYNNNEDSFIKDLMVICKILDNIIL